MQVKLWDSNEKVLTELAEITLRSVTLEANLAIQQWFERHGNKPNKTTTMAFLTAPQTGTK